MRSEDERYFGRLEDGLDAAMAVASEAKARGDDPEPEVEIPIAVDMAARVENILGIEGVAERVRELEEQMSREEAALELAEDFAEGNVGDYETREGKIEGAVRTAVALLTEGVVAAPIEGIDRVEILPNDDGTEYVGVYYAGPIRSAGGTAQALSVLVADYTRALIGIDEYKARDEEVERYAEEVALYDSETGLQYTPKDKETKFIARNAPICLDGEATGQEEVSGFRDLERVGTNNPRGGMCLVLAEGIALKAPKIQRYTRNLEEIDWPWLQDLIDGTIGKDDDAGDEEESEADEGESDAAAEAEDDEPDPGKPDGPVRVDPATKYLRDLIAGRPVFSHPSKPGGFRLRYGRSRNHGFATAGVHPAAMHILDDFLATGTQIKTERPGKAGGVIPVDSIEGPTVKLANGDVRRVDDPAEALEIRNGVVEIIDLGEYLVNYGEFVENNHPLAPASYVYEWWVQDLDATDADVRAMRDSPHVDLEDPSAEEAIEWATEYDAPLHPKYTYLWHDVDTGEFERLADAVADAEEWEGRLAVENTDEVRRALEVILVQHRQTDDHLLIPDWKPLAASLGVVDGERTWNSLSDEARDWPNAHEAVNEVAPFALRERAPTRIGNRMGRPEKSEKRELSPAVHTLFPIGEAGGSQRSVSEAASHTEGLSGVTGAAEVELGQRRCPDCDTETFKTRCPDCETRTEPYYECPSCEIEVEPDEGGRLLCPRCEKEATSLARQTINVGDEYRGALASVGERENAYDILKGVKGLMSSHKTPEPMEKGILRAKHGVSAFKDGTIRYDMTDLPVTAIRPAEVDVTVEQFRELGYHEDMDGDPLRHDDQLVELRVQDIILSDGAAEHLIKTANFVDALLEQYYGLDPYYGIEERDELVGELVFGMAPHTSAAVVGRIVGFTSAAVGYAHPYFHAAKRRNCFHPETKIWYEDENGSAHYDRIDDFVENYLNEDVAESDDFGSLVDRLDDLDGTLRVPSLDEKGVQQLQTVEAVSKHPAPDHMVQVRTRSGRELVVTPDHRIHVYDSDTDRINTVEARDLDDADNLVTPRHLDSLGSGRSHHQFDLLEEFVESNAVDADRLMVKGLNKDRLYDLFTDRLSDSFDGRFYPLQNTADYLGLTKERLSNYLYRESIPVTLLLEFFESIDELLAFVPTDATLGMKRDRTEIDRFVELNERVATLLGYYAAEGFAREYETSKGTIHQTTICGTETEAREFFLETLRDEFGSDPYEENHAKITASGRLLRTFFDTILDAGIYAHTKQVPQCIFDGSNAIIGAYLSGYFSGDGSIDPSSTVVSASTVSPVLEEHLVALLSRLGISARVRRTSPRLLQKQFPEFHTEGDLSTSRTGYVVSLSGGDAVKFREIAGFHLDRENKTLHQNTADLTDSVGITPALDGGSEDYAVDEIESIEIIESDTKHVYCLTVADTHSLVVNDLSAAQCDGDEDCVMLLMDGLLNFSKSFLPDKRGGKMDAPLVMSSRIDPAEIDDEAHNMDIVDQYPREFYEASLRMADPGEVEDVVRIAEETLGTDEQYTGFRHTHDTTNIALGPDLSAYKTLGSMMDKMNAQLELARKLRAVDETDVAERVIEGHFLPDLIGNLRAFSRQETRCLDCGMKYRRMPLTGDCRECGGRVNLTVHQGSVNKYMDTALEVAREYGAREYTIQRLEILEQNLESVFENDKNKQSGIADFM